MLKITEYLTLGEVEEYYQIKADTLRAYIYRGQVIPKEVIIKKYGRWMLLKSWVDSKYEKRY